MAPLIEARGVYKSFGAVQALKGFNLAIRGNEIYGLVGPDGAGKTTAVRLLAGVMFPDEGEIFADGYSMERQAEQARGRIGYLSQRFSLYDELTVMENVRFFAEVRGLSPSEWKARTLETLTFVGLEPFVDRQAAHLSGGMKQKLGLAAALVHQPRILLLDEPTRGVDPVTRQDFWQLIIRLVNEEGVAVLITTTYMDEASRCTRVGFLQTGQMRLESPPDELRKRLEGQVLELLGEPLPLLRRLAAADPDIEAAHAFGDRLHLRLRPGTSTQVISRLEQEIPAMGGRITRLRPIQPQLEDVFISLMEV
ncbi:MAG TPA: ABC transporter ATP-binding protein [Anaerolineales bacterium]|nr:ABC transporter ATP-binding protein [Anaerolineales bacterium]